MPENADNPFSFWQELKRRKVIRVIIVYAAQSFVILELVSIIAEPWRNTKNLSRGAKPIWPYLKCLCSYTGLNPVQKIQFRLLSNMEYGLAACDKAIYTTD